MFEQKNFLKHICKDWWLNGFQLIKDQCNAGLGDIIYLSTSKTNELRRNMSFTKCKTCINLQAQKFCQWQLKHSWQCNFFHSLKWELDLNALVPNSKNRNHIHELFCSVILWLHEIQICTAKDVKIYISLWFIKLLWFLQWLKYWFSALSCTIYASTIARICVKAIIHQ
jgi:hypothetical protein